VRASIRAALEASARVRPITTAKRRKLWSRTTEEEGAALLAKYAPDWKEHLKDDGVIDRILDGIARL
jgi:hypothetical protein